ncbi:hypothetical protein ACFXTH_003228 [Malus domestica]
MHRTTELQVYLQANSLISKDHRSTVNQTASPSPPVRASCGCMGNLSLSKIEQRRLLLRSSSFFLCLLACFFYSDNHLTAMLSSSSVTGLEGYDLDWCR